MSADIRACAATLQLAATAALFLGVSGEGPVMPEIESRVVSLLAPVFDTLAEKSRPWLDTDPTTHLVHAGDRLRRIRSRVSASLDPSDVSAALECELPAGMPARVPLEFLAAGPARAVGAGGRDSSEHQAMRDVERDVVSVNGEVMSGSARGFDAIVAAILSAFTAARRNLVSDEPARRSAEAARARALAVSLLRIGNRTVSGGDAFEAVALLLCPRPGDGLDARIAARLPAPPEAPEGACTAAGVRASDGWDADWPDDAEAEAPRSRSASGGGLPLVLVADSKAAPPIAFTIDAGPFLPPPSAAAAPADVGAPTAASQVSACSDGPGPCYSQLKACAAARVGLRCCVRATTVYRVMAAPPSDDKSGGDGDLVQLARVAATYVAHVAWPLPDDVGAPEKAARVAKHAGEGAPVVPAVRPLQQQQQHAGAAQSRIASSPPRDRRARSDSRERAVPPPVLHRCGLGGHIEVELLLV